MKKLIIFIVLLSISLTSGLCVFADDVLYSKVLSSLNVKTQDIYEQLDILQQLAKVAEREWEEEYKNFFIKLAKELRIQIIKHENTVQEITIWYSTLWTPIKAYYKWNPNKEFTLFVANIHGWYEYGTYLTALELRDKLTKSNKKGWMIIPTLNPDWLSYYFENKESEKYYLEWRPNARGIDLNRNFCTKSYNSHFYLKEDILLNSWTRCESELETQAFSSLLKQYNFKSLIDIHSAGGIIFIPENSFDDETVIEFATKVDEALSLKYYFKYQYENEKQKEELIKQYEIDSWGEWEFIGTMITYFYEQTGRPAVLVEMWDHGRIEEALFWLVNMVD